MTKRTESARNFEKGDKVRVKTSLEEDKFYSGLFFHPQMKKYRGEEAEVEDFDLDGYYKLSGISGGWVFNDDMLIDPSGEEIPLGLKRRIRRAVDVSRAKWQDIEEKIITGDRYEQEVAKSRMNDPCGFCDEFTCDIDCPVEIPCNHIQDLANRPIDEVKGLESYLLGIVDKAMETIDEQEDRILDDTRGKKESPFKKDDLVKGVRNTRYNLTNESMKLGKIINTEIDMGVGLGEVEVEILVHKDPEYEGRSFVIANSRDYITEADIQR